MSCTNHLLNVQWEHHSWHRRVSSTETVSSSLSDMWGRVVNNEYVKCHTEEVCTACGATRDAGDCLCDPGRGEHCAPRLEFLEEVRQKKTA